jgi:hypothetical protein
MNVYTIEFFEEYPRFLRTDFADAVRQLKDADDRDGGDRLGDYMCWVQNERPATISDCTP